MSENYSSDDCRALMRETWNRASDVLQFSRQELDRLISPIYSDARVVRWEATKGGLANTNIRLHLDNRNDPILLRVFVRDPNQAQKEWKISELVRTSVPIPEFIYFAPTNEFTGHPYILMEWIEAHRLEERILELEPGEIEDLGIAIGSALAAIHSHTFSCAGFFDADLNVRDKINLGSAGIQSFAKSCLGDGIAVQRLGLSLTDRLLEFLRSESSLLDEWQGIPCLSHSDFGASNILVESQSGKWRVAAVLDWEFAFSGTPFFDF
jgi:aminoglycoside phosphotransferase (APT) family kinase protein